MQRTPRARAEEQQLDERPHTPTRGKTTRSKRQDREFYSDEHPEIPKIRRASLQLDETRTAPSSSARSTHPTRKERPSSPMAKSTHPTRKERPPSPSARQGRFTRSSQSAPSQAPSTPDGALYEDEYQYDEHAIPPTPNTTGRIMVAQRRRPAVYEPPSKPHHRTRRPSSRANRPHTTLLTRLYDLSHKRGFLFIGIILLALVLGPLVVNLVSANLIHNGNTVLLFPSLGSASTPNAKQSTRVPNSHNLVIVPSDTDHPAPPVYASAAYLYDANTGATLYAHNPFTHLPILSTTKLMTALIAVEQGNPDQQITITDAIANDINQLSADSSLMGIKRGETYTLRELLYGLLLPSGNDAAVAIADGLDGNLQTFVAKMNERAEQLGMYDTHYMNPHGLLDPGHYSCAHDLAIIGKVALSNPLLHQISETREYHIPATKTHAEHSFINGNQFLWWYPGVDGGKPGWDGNSDFNQVISCIRNGHHLIGVVLNTNDWWTDMRDLMNWGFDTFNWTSPADVVATTAIPYAADWNYFVKDTKNRTIPTAEHGRYYIYTGYTVDNPVLTFFDKSGGLKKFGYPIALPKTIAGSTVSQRFEHATIQCIITTRQCSTV